MNDFIAGHTALVVLAFSLLSGLVVLLSGLLYKLGIQSLQRMEKSIRSMGDNLSRHMSDTARHIHELETEINTQKYNNDLRFQRVEMVCANHHGITFDKRVSDSKEN